MNPIYKRHLGTTVTLIVLLLASACGQAMPAATSIPPTSVLPPTATALPPTKAAPSPAPPEPSALPEPTVPPAPTTGPAGDGIVEGWAVLAEKNDYSDVEMSDLLVDYVNSARVGHVLEEAGWEADQIHQVREFDREDLQDELDWLAEHADQDDIAFLYVGAHGRYLRDVIRWEDFFADAWAEIPSHRRLLLVDSCQSARYTGVVSEDPQPHLTIAVADQDEYGWWGIEEEGLPIIGGVFTYYFTTAFSDTAASAAADADGNGMVSIQEATLWAEEQQRTYMHEVVFAVPEFLESYHDIGVQPEEDPTFPDVILDDTIGEPLYFTLQTYRAKEETMGATGPVTFTIIYDNNPYDPNLRMSWGFACWIETEEQVVLFDTGADGPTLLGNMEKLGLAPEAVDLVVLSHIHGDHVSGLPGLLEAGADPVIYVPSQFPPSFKDNLRAQGYQVEEASKFTEVRPGLYTTGGLGTSIVEQALAVSTPAGLVVVTGCAHPGVDHMVRSVVDNTQAEIVLVIGGFHLRSASRSHIEGIIANFRQMGVQRVAPVHCSGDQARQIFAQAYGEDCLLAGVGQVVVVGSQE